MTSRVNVGQNQSARSAYLLHLAGLLIKVYGIGVGHGFQPCRRVPHIS
jgi:hypothetical protein